MALEEVNFDEIPDAGKEWNSVKAIGEGRSKPAVRGITVIYPTVALAPPPPDAKPKRSIIKRGDAPKSRKKVKFNNRGRPAGSGKTASKHPVISNSSTEAASTSSVGLRR